MIIKPKVRGFICITAHPIGCRQHVLEQINVAKKDCHFKGPKNVLVLGGSTGYGLASRIVAAFGAGAGTISVAYEKLPRENKTASAGWYNTVAFEEFAHAENIYAKSLNGDAFSNELKQQTIDLIKKDVGKIDLVIYSLASPRRIHPETGETFRSTLKPIGENYVCKTVDPMTGVVKEITLEPASEKEVSDTVAVMGGEDWALWIDALMKADCLADSAKTLAYSYIGPTVTHPIYKDGAIGMAKEHLYKTGRELNEKLKSINGSAAVSVNKAIVTQSSAAIPVVPLYISLLYKLMTDKNTHEDAIQQMVRLFNDRIYVDNAPIVDENDLIRMDDLEMESDIQESIQETWPKLTTENLESLTDIQIYRDEFYKLFGFGLDNVDYEEEVELEAA